MAIRNRTIIRQEQAFAAGDAAITDNLPVNPLSFVDIVLRGAALAANTLPTLANMLAVLTRIEVLFKGSSIISLTPADLYVLGHAIGWARALPQPHADTGADVWRMLLRVSFTRRPFWMEEGFPASRSGELQIRYTPAAAFTNVAGLSLHVETEEILDGQFKRFLKYTTLTRTPAATGESDVDLPIGNPYAGVLLFGTTVPTGTAVTASFRETRLLIDNQESFIPRTRWDALHQYLASRADHALWLAEHSHRTGAAIPGANELLEAAQYTGTHLAANYGLLDFDPLIDGSYFLQTAGRSRVQLRINADVADVQRIIPVEIIELAQAQAA
jgi:hypothetical protein